ncbi:amidophosphoribosyltransferase [Moritella sp. 36]|uniref:ComF family protein n=1 Tax=Moritella sp. 36 TaxID=2746233 RepID=UPI001BA7BE15|nr:phosphoribosyltransferase family protein [Moritella sp. 36]QUM87488.1 amidophosphoribosyltransferase [Moritella sp. 36]
MIRKLSIILLQPRCYLCDMPIDNLQPFLCLLCQQELPYLPVSSCYRCALPLTINQQGQCHECRHQEPPWQRLIASMNYSLECQYLIKQYKFSQQPQLHLLFSQLISRSVSNNVIQHNYSLPEALLSIPLHKKRLAKRGYNQAHLLAQDLAKQLQIPLIAEKIFIRTKNTKAQAKQTAAERSNNMHNAFQVTQAITVKHVAIIDDVVTTGETMKTACQALFTAGVERIDIWCIARTLAD